MKKADFIKEVSIKASVNQVDSAAVIDAFIDTVSDILKSGDKISIAGLGTFSVSMRNARKGRNPSTGEEIDIAAKNVVKFKPAPKLKDSV